MFALSAGVSAERAERDCDAYTARDAFLSQRVNGAVRLSPIPAVKRATWVTHGAGTLKGAPRFALSERVHGGAARFDGRPTETDQKGLFVSDPITVTEAHPLQRSWDTQH
ncbi:hypothetical protein SKAU_G00292590 [Synaphobranchus kaupii]|uniref:Uncharacterized protein n=1 Tax=Synaphobranchus kaupii TaxID=118154 RepID=A0A9Q1EU18_SYNKA|nr:hypothetical protein SKAU_G00292590 [Synaphobranchus kaupii]